MCFIEFDFAARIRLVAKLVLQALDADCIDAAVGQPARQKEAAQPRTCLREHEERVAHRRREEPLVADEAVALTPRVDAIRQRLRRVGANVGPTLLLGHSHAHRHSGLLRRRNEARVIGSARELRPPLGGYRSVTAQRRSHRVGHRDRAQHRRLELGEQHEGGRALDVRAGRP